MHSNVIVALEGLIHAGKTTLLRGIRKTMQGRVCCIDEYATYKGLTRFPDFPKTSGEAIEANEFFVELEGRRFADVTGSGLVLLDRSLLSVLAYHYATERVTGGAIVCFEQSLRFFRENLSHCMPASVIRLDVSREVFEERHATDSGFYKPILLDDEFNRNLVLFYDNLGTYFPNMEVRRIDADASKAIVLQKALEILAVV